MQVKSSTNTVATVEKETVTNGTIDNQENKVPTVVLSTEIPLKYHIQNKILFFDVISFKIRECFNSTISRSCDIK